jgi:putative membrane protein
MRKTLTATTIAALAALLATGSIALGSAHSAKTNSSLGLDENWLSTSIQGDRFEIAGGQMALQKSQNAAVRTLAQTLVTDHTKSLKATIKVANKLHTQIPHQPSESQAWELRIVSSFSGTDFDRWYSSLEVADHKQDISEASAEHHNGKQAHVRAMAGHEIPTLKKHLNLAEAAVKAVGG